MANPRRIGAAAAAEHTATEQMARGERAAESLAAAATKGAQAWLGSQADLWREFDTAGRGFMQRRREAIESAQRALEEMQACRDVVDALKIQQHFVADAMQRLAAEMGELSVLALTFSQRTMGGLLKSGRTMAEEGRGAEDFALSAAGAKPAAAAAKPGNPGNPGRRRRRA